MHTSGSTRRLRQRVAPARAPSPSESPPVNGDVDARGESQPHEAKRARKVVSSVSLKMLTGQALILVDTDELRAM